VQRRCWLWRRHATEICPTVDRTCHGRKNATEPGCCIRHDLNCPTICKKCVVIIIVNNNSNTHDNVYGAVIMTKSLQELPRSSDQRRTAPRCCRPSDQANRVGLWTAIVYTYHHHLLLLSQKAATHFTITRRIEVWVDLYLHTTPAWHSHIKWTWNAKDIV